MKTIIYNGRINSKNGLFDGAILIEDGIISKMCSDSEILASKDENTEIIDLGGRLVLPGFNDSHMHFLNIGYYYSQLDLGETGSIREAVEKGKGFIEEHQTAPGQWVLCYGWNDENWEEKRFITRSDLDEISSEHPVAAVRVCTHVLTVNSKALQLLGLEDAPEDGVLCEYLPMLYEFLPEPTVEQIKEMLIMVGNAAASKGLTSVQSDDLESIPGSNFKNIIRAYAELAAEDKLPVRVYEQCRLHDCDALKKFTDAGFHTGMGKDRFRLGPLKTFCDGSLGARTAWLKDDYSDDPGNRGLCVYDDPEVLNQMVLSAHERGMSVALHCIGDAAAEQAVTAIEKAMKQNPRGDVRHGIVHAQVLNEDLINRIEALGIVTYIQPVFLEYDLKIAEKRLGSQRLIHSYNYRELYDRGICVPLGTDSPVEDFSPMKNLYCAVTGKDFDGKPEEGWHPEKLLTLEEALRCYTEYSAYASFEEDKKGVLAPGYYADMTVLEKDIFKIQPEAIKDVDIYMTIMGGKIRYQK